MPRGRGIDKQLQLTLSRRVSVPDDERDSVRTLAAMVGTSKSTVHRYVNRGALLADRRRSAKRRERMKRQAHR